MKASVNLFEHECLDDAIVVTATRDLSEFEYETLESEAAEVLTLLGKGEFKNVVVDLSQSEYCGSTALGLFLKLWKYARQNDGAVAFCGLSDNEREVFNTMKLDSLWPICETREEALAAVRP